MDFKERERVNYAAYCLIHRPFNLFPLHVSDVLVGDPREGIDFWMYYEPVEETGSGHLLHELVYRSLFWENNEYRLIQTREILEEYSGSQPHFCSTSFQIGYEKLG